MQWPVRLLRFQRFLHLARARPGTGMAAVAAAGGLRAGGRGAADASARDRLLGFPGRRP